MKTSEAFDKLRDFRGTYLYKLCISIEDGKKISPDEIWIENPKDPDEMGKWHEIQKIYSLLDEAFSLVKYYDLPVVGEGRLTKNQNGRYQCSGMELTSGCVIELLDEDDETPRWVRTAIEHNGEDYYALSLRGALEGKLARYR